MKFTAPMAMPMPKTMPASIRLLWPSPKANMRLANYDCYQGQAGRDGSGEGGLEDIDSVSDGYCRAAGHTRELRIGRAVEQLREGA